MKPRIFKSLVDPQYYKIEMNCTICRDKRNMILEGESHLQCKGCGVHYYLGYLRFELK